jgi:hypothetical protein
VISAPGQVARAFGLYYAKLFVGEDDAAASAAQIRGFARRLKITCSAPKEGQYPCSVVVPGRPAQPCAAVVTASGSVTGRCTDGDRAAPLATAGYVGCATIGHVVSIADPSGDQMRVVPGLRSQHLVAGSDPRADLLQVRVAATHNRFCVDFDTRGPLTTGTWMGIDITRNGAVDTEFSPTINDRRNTGPQPESPVNTPIAGQIGTSGNWSSLVITGNSIPRPPFQLTAYVNHEFLQSGVTQLTADRTPGTGMTTYP